MILMREAIASRSFSGGAHHVVEHAVDAEPDAELLLVRLDVDVAGALLRRADTASRSRGG